MKSFIFSNAGKNKMLQHWLELRSGAAHSTDPICGEVHQLGHHLYSFRVFSQYRLISHWQNPAGSKEMAFKTPLSNIHSYIINEAAVTKLFQIIIHMNETLHYTLILKCALTTHWVITY